MALIKPPPDGVHPRPDDLLALVRKTCQASNSGDYARRTAEMLKRQFPVTAASVMPELRKIYREFTRAR